VKPIAIIGIGSPYGADQTGWRAVEFLKQDHTLQTLSRGQINFMSCDRPGVMLLDDMAGFDCVILIDAVAGGDRGKVAQISKTDLLNDQPGCSTHDFGVAQALALGSQLDSLPETIELIGIEVGDAAMNYLPEVETLTQLKQLIYALVRRFLLSP